MERDENFRRQSLLLPPQLPQNKVAQPVQMPHNSDFDKRRKRQEEAWSMLHGTRADLSGSLAHPIEEALKKHKKFIPPERRLVMATSLAIDIDSIIKGISPSLIAENIVNRIRETLNQSGLAIPQPEIPKIRKSLIDAIKTALRERI